MKTLCSFVPGMQASTLVDETQRQLRLVRPAVQRSVLWRQLSGGGVTWRSEVPPAGLATRDDVGYQAAQAVPGDGVSTQRKHDAKLLTTEREGSR